MRSRSLLERGSATQIDAVFLEDGRPAELPGFDPHFGRWVAQLREQQKSHSTLCTYPPALARCIATLQAICGTEVTVWTISSLEPAIFEQMQQQMLEEGAVDRTIMVRMAALRSFAKFLNRCGYARCDALLVSHLIDFAPRSLHTPGEEDCNNLIPSDEQGITWQTLRNRAVLRLISAHSLTIAEALAIDREHFCFVRHTLSIVGSLRPRTIPVETHVVEDIAAYLEVCPYEIENGSPLFRGTRGARLTARVVQLAAEALRNQLGLHVETTPRTIRKSRVLQLVASGVPTYEIMQQVGISASAMSAILSEAPVNPLLAEEAVRKANLILERLRSMGTDDDHEQHRRLKSDPNNNVPKSKSQRSE
ncbi:tyrosine-type recombinase/integrase [Bradyrhizobium sp. RDI18]|uniref:tyrosine-type recombinase/integrase n=1 Tax=Bradyrhizobium sp. RDI18 TaxID=3367400 RepID=UPI0037228CAA